MKRRVLFAFVIVAFLVTVAVSALSVLPAVSLAGRFLGPAGEELKTFASYRELVSYIEERSAAAHRLGWGLYGARPKAGGWTLAPRMAAEETQALKAAPPAAGGVPDALPEAARDYSATNVQVAGVDEADIVKTDGEHLYVLSGNEVVILKAYPAKEARVLARLHFPGTSHEAFIAENRLVVLGGKAGEFLAHVYDVSSKEEPRMTRRLSLPGRYVTSRLIGDYAYVIITAPVYEALRPGKEKVVLPRIKVDGEEQTVPPTHIHYFDVPDHSFQYTVILAVNVQDENEPVTEKTFLTGVSQNVFVSREHIYLTAGKMPDLVRLSRGFFERIIPVLPGELRAEMAEIRDAEADFAAKLRRAESLIDDYLYGVNPAGAGALLNRIAASYEDWRRDIAREQNMTVIHKLAAAGDTVEYLCKGEVPGQVLNQFSMDEYQGFFRIATTSERFAFSGPWERRNNLYVLDEKMRVTGRLEGLAPGERIYAARFMGKRCYLVTFRQIDPLFVIDLQDPHEPKVLGELKIPGYSNYLHPYDEHHLIGIGKEVAVEPVIIEDFVGEKAVTRVIPPGREIGIKVSLFDVTDPAKPLEVAKYIIEGWRADSPALRDHKAVLFSRSKNLLAVPVSLGYWTEERGGCRQWQGAYIFDISLKGISLKGTVSHGPEGRPDFPEYNRPVKRCLYIEDVLYSVSERMVKANDLETLKEINRIQW